MVYKSKKINKRYNLKNFSKRQSRKKNKYGGSDINNQNNEQAADDIMNKIEEQNKVELPSIEEIPIVGPVLNKTGDLIEGTAIKSLDNVGNLIGIDIDNPNSISDKLNNISNAIKSPENIEKTKEIIANASKYGEILIDAASPVIEKTVDKI